MREENLFYKLTSDNEDAVTELLCNLCRFDDFRKIIFETMNINNEYFHYSNMDTQYKIPRKNKRPDIVIENNDKIIFIENKVTKYRKLEKSQLTDYPKYLRSITKKDIMLIYLIPKGYKYIEDIILAGKKYDFISIVYWDELLENMKSKNCVLKSEILVESISYFEKVLNSILDVSFTEEDIKFMGNINQLMIECTTMGKVLELFLNVIEQLVEKLNLKSKKGYSPNPEISENGLGYYFFNDNCYLGYSFGFVGDKLSEEYVMSFAVKNDMVSMAKLKNVSYSYFTDEEYHYFKIDSNWLEGEKKETELLKQCERYMKDIVKNVK